MPLVDVPAAIVGFAELPNRLKTGRSAYDLAGEVFDALLARTGFDPADIDGLAVVGTMSEAPNPFYPAYLAESLGLSPAWLESLHLGGVSCVGGVARALAAIHAGLCRAVVLIAVDAQATRNPSEQGAYRPEFLYPVGLRGPVGAFGLLSQRYHHQYGLDASALAKLAVVQRQHALLNPLACSKLRSPITEADYLASRYVSEPLRLLDSVMVCDGGSALLIVADDVARGMSVRRSVRVRAYAERTHHNLRDPLADITESGFTEVGPRVLRQAGLTPQQIHMFHPYDDFLIAIQMQFEQIGFCPLGQGARFIHDTDLSYRGTLPLNTGGGQISAGQPGLAGGGVNLTEAVRQLLGEGEARQVARADNALVTGIGVIPYGRNWSTSAAMVLEAGEPA